MNRVFDERLELQLQEYELAEVEQLLPARPVFRMPVEQDSNEPVQAVSVSWH